MNYPGFIQQIPPWALFMISIWSIFWKGLALWYAAKGNQRNWFVIILILNLFGIFEIIYLFFFAKKKLKLEDLKIWKQIQKP